ncbi:MAG: hypothetical protein H6603_01920 [Flavobacteriales bacterium]|nr:hypothetical protein [Flavobacteriales bacterium]
MDKQTDEYDEELLKVKNAKKPFVKYLSAEKKQLREQIMKQMRAYRSDSTVDNKINELLQDEAFYRDKGLKALREKAIAKAKELATKYERFYLLQEILEKEIAYVEEFEEKNVTNPVLALIAEWKDILIKQQTFLELWSNNKEIFAGYRSGEDIKDEYFINRMRNAIKEVEFYRARTIGSFRLQRAFHRAYSNYHNVFMEDKLSFESTVCEYQLFQEFPQFKLESSHDYKVCLSNLVSRAQSAGKEEEFLQYISELKKLPTSSFNDDGEVFQNVYFLEHLYYINKGNFHQAESLIAEIERGLNEFGQKINKARRLTFLYNIMIMYFLMHEFKKCTKWADEILSDKSEIKQNVTTITKVLLPIIHFELGHHDLVENLTRSAYRHLKNKKRLHEFERLVLHYFKEMPFSVDNDSFYKSVLSFQDSLSQIMDDPNQKILLGMEELKLWCISRTKGILMSEQLAQQSQ